MAWSLLINQTASNWLQFALATPVVLWAGWPFFERGWKSIQTRNLNMFTLIAIGAGVAWIYSVVATFFPENVPPHCADTMEPFRLLRGRRRHYRSCADRSGPRIARAREQTGGAIRALLNLTPKTARRLSTGDSEQEVDIDAVSVGDRLRVRPGERIPVDGEVIDGRRLRRRVHGDG